MRYCGALIAQIAFFLMVKQENLTLHTAFYFPIVTTFLVSAYLLKVLFHLLRRYCAVFRVSINMCMLFSPELHCC